MIKGSNATIIEINIIAKSNGTDIAIVTPR